jgi:hypothetical protein
MERRDAEVREDVGESGDRIAKMRLAVAQVAA